jgi:signal peptidase I
VEEEGRSGVVGGEEPAGEKPPRQPEANLRGWGGRLFSTAAEFAVLAVIALLISIFLQAFLVKAYEIPSVSMEPTLKVGDRVLVDRLAYHLREPHRGEVVVFRYDPGDPANWTQGSNGLTRSLDQVAEVINITHRESTPFIKRVVGLPGETVEVREGSVYINGELLQEDYQLVRGGPEGIWQVGEEEVFVMGDNRPNSNDSRMWGCVPYQAIIGRAVLIWWPKSRWGSLK